MTETKKVALMLLSVLPANLDKQSAPAGGLQVGRLRDIGEVTLVGGHLHCEC